MGKEAVRKEWELEEGRRDRMTEDDNTAPQSRKEKIANREDV